MDQIKNGPRLRLVRGDAAESAGDDRPLPVMPAAPVTPGRLAGGAGRGPGLSVGHAAAAHPVGAMPAAFWTRRLREEPDRLPLRASARLASAANTAAVASADPAEEVERENISAAATMAATDPRWVLALRVYESIEGGRAAILRPQKRRNLVALATRLGLRPFDANLIIAIVQDAARCGEAPMGPAVAGRLTLVRTPGREGGEEPRFGLRVLLGAMGVAAVLGYLIFDALVAWVAR